MQWVYQQVTLIDPMTRGLKGEFLYLPPTVTQSVTLIDPMTRGLKDKKDGST